MGFPIPGGDELTVEAEVERLDGLAWEIQEDSAAQHGDYELAFRRARAVNAYFLAKYRGSAAEPSMRLCTRLARRATQQWCSI